MVVVISDNTFSINAKHIPKNKNVNKYRFKSLLNFSTPQFYAHYNYRSLVMQALLSVVVTLKFILCIKEYPSIMPLNGHNHFVTNLLFIKKAPRHTPGSQTHNNCLTFRLFLTAM
jgi:hypothetical protein